MSGLVIGKTGVTYGSSKSYREGWFLQGAVSESTGLRNCMTVAVFRKHETLKIQHVTTKWNFVGKRCQFLQLVNLQSPFSELSQG